MNITILTLVWMHSAPSSSLATPPCSSIRAALKGPARENSPKVQFVLADPKWSFLTFL